MSKVSDALLNQCLEQLENGRSLDSIEARYSRIAAELRPLLSCTGKLQQLPVDPPPALQQQAKAGFLARATAQARRDGKRWTWLTFRPH